LSNFDTVRCRRWRVS